MSQSETSPKPFWFASRGVWLFLIASILLLAYTFYRAEITYHGLKGDLYTKYYLISFVGIVFWGWVLRLTDEIKLNILMVTTSLAVGLYLVEIALNFIAPPDRSEIAKAAGVEFDKRTKYEVYRDMKSNGVDAVPSVHPTYFCDTNGVAGKGPLFPLACISGKTTVVYNETGKFMIFQSDRYGFNNPDSEWRAIQTEWLLTGDSFTQGLSVQTGEDIGGQIRKITKQSVINLGYSGNGPLIELAALKEYAEIRKPKIVLWIYYEGNDLVTDLSKEKSAPLLMSYLQPKFSQNLIYRQTEIDDRLGKHIAKDEAVLSAESKANAEAISSRTKVLRLYNIRKRIENLFLDLNDEVRVEPLFTEILTKARDQTASLGGNLYFVYLPDFPRYATAVQNHETHRKYREVIDAVKSLNIPVIDIHQEVFKNHPDQLSLFPFRLPGHYTAEGYSKVAEAIVSGVRNEQLKHSNISVGTR